jgi:hypothetical protein
MWKSLHQPTGRDDMDYKKWILDIGLDICRRFDLQEEANELIDSKDSDRLGSLVLTLQEMYTPEDL